MAAWTIWLLFLSLSSSSFLVESFGIASQLPQPPPPKHCHCRQSSSLSSSSSSCSTITSDSILVDNSRTTLFRGEPFVSSRPIALLGNDDNDDPGDGEIDSYTTPTHCCSQSTRTATSTTSTTNTLLHHQSVPKLWSRRRWVLSSSSLSSLCLMGNTLLYPNLAKAAARERRRQNDVELQ